MKLLKKEIITFYKQVTGYNDWKQYHKRQWKNKIKFVGLEKKVTELWKMIMNSLIKYQTHQLTPLHLLVILRHIVGSYIPEESDIFIAMKLCHFLCSRFVRSLQKKFILYITQLLVVID